MTSPRERLVAAISGTRADRIPVFCNLLDQGAAELGLPLARYYGSGEAVAEGQLRLRARYGYDNLWSLFYVGKEAELLGCREILFSEDGPPNVAHYVINDAADIHALQVPESVLEHPGFAEVRRSIRLMRAEVGRDVPICAYVTASMALPALLMGMERWMELLLLGPAALRDELLAKCSTFFALEAAAYREAGADVLLYSNPFGSLDLLPARLFHALAVPWMRRDLAPGGTSDVAYYCGGSRMNRVIETVIEQIGVRAFYLSPDDDLAEATRILDGRGLACGVINDLPLVRASVDEVRTSVRRLIEAGKDYPRFLFGTLLMPLSIPEQNIHALVDTACEAGAWGPGSRTS